MRLLENSVGEYADRLVSIERAYQLGIAHNIARIYADILNEPLPSEFAPLGCASRSGSGSERASA